LSFGSRKTCHEKRSSIAGVKGRLLSYSTRSPAPSTAPRPSCTNVELPARDRIDLLQLRWPPNDGTEPEEYWQTLIDLKRAGKIRAAGVSNFRLELLTAFDAIGHVDSLHPPLSLINRAATDDLLPWCSQNETGVVVYSPLQSGLLTGRWSSARVAALPADDWRHAAPYFTTRLDLNLSLAQAPKPIAERHQTSQAAVALAWAVAQVGVTGAIVGARRPEQIDDWIKVHRFS
jgi:aryl-alcohol dehydrogenase-like predicted oxidoreductase